MCSIATAFIASSLFSAYGTYRQGQAQAASAQFNARVAENNAIATEQQIETVTTQEGMEKEQLRRKADETRAAGRVGYASSGVVVGTGSALDWELSLTQQEEADIDTIAYNADLERHALKTEAQSWRTTGQARRAEAREYKTSSLLGAGTSLLGSYYTYKTRF